MKYKNGLAELVFTCHNYIIHYFKNLTHMMVTQNFLDLHMAPLKIVLGNDHLDVASENTVFTALFLWLEHDQQRKKYALDLFTCIRFPHLGLAYILQVVPHLFRRLPKKVRKMFKQRYREILEEKLKGPCKRIAPRPSCKDYVSVVEAEFGDVEKMFATNEICFSTHVHVGGYNFRVSLEAKENNDGPRELATWLSIATNPLLPEGDYYVSISYYVEIFDHGCGQFSELCPSQNGLIWKGKSTVGCPRIVTSEWQDFVKQGCHIKENRIIIRFKIKLVDVVEESHLEELMGNKMN